jgi:hypothetical protein
VRNIIRPFNHDINFIELKERIRQKITHHLADLDRTKKNDKQKILELCQIGKLLATYYSDFDIVDVREKPDFLISNGQTTIGLEHELILDSKSKEKEGFYQNICEKVEARLNEDSDLPNFLVNLYLKENISLKIQDKNSITDKFSEIVKQIVLTGEMEENDFIERAIKMKHSGKSVNPNFGAYWQKSITENLILEFIAKKESKIDFYRQNSVPTQWLVLIIGSNRQSSFEVNSLFNVDIQTKFDKVFLYEDFDNKLYELK